MRNANEVGLYDLNWAKFLNMLDGGVPGAKGRPEQAALLLGASEAIFNGLGVEIFSLSHHRLVDYKGWVANVRSQLDEATFKAAWIEGRAMTLEQSIEYALEVDYE